MSAKPTVAIIGAAGTSGGELLRLVSGRSDVLIEAVAGRSSAGSTVSTIHPHLGDGVDMQIVAAEEIGAVDVAFVALPHRGAADVAPALLERGTRVIDLSGDFRLDAEAYPPWYGFEHPAPAWLDKAVYGLPERNREQIGGADLVANPGCFPTAIVLGLAPLLERRLLDPSGVIVVDGKTGLSGAGRSATPATSYLSTEESVRPYRFPRHQHTPELERSLEDAAGTSVAVSFVPHLVPAVRGVLTTSFARAAASATSEALTHALREAYADEPFVRVLAPDVMADTKRVRGSNVVELQAVVDERTSTAIVVAALDNLVKGAAGQAIQNMNLMLGLGETTGLPTTGMYP